ITLSMAATPLLFAAAERWLMPKLERREERAFDTIDDSTPPVIICGFGRVGQIVGRILRLRGIPFTALEQDVAQVDFVRRFGNKVYYGDPTRPDLLRAAGAKDARVLIVALADIEQSLRVVDLAKSEFPHLTLIVRARNRRHAHLLMDRGVRRIVRETFHSSLVLSGQVLRELGISEDETARMLATFETHDERTLARQQAVHHDETQLIQSSRQAAEELRSLFETDRRD
ncbi:MAG TPA: NAD-binding protein, partial [Arenibaculum sp.]|nr:NAD-binding protein [Arenibaculum sp.]